MTLRWIALILLSMNTKTKDQLIEFLLNYITENKKNKMAQALEYRTRHLAIVMEDIYQAHNANAVIRSAECFGIQDLHVIEDRHRFSVSKSVSKGATDWISVYRYKSSKDCFKALKDNGYRIIATTPHAKAQSLYDLKLDKKCAIIFGKEATGLTEYALENADEYMAIPMYGFTQSFNVSVSVGLCCQSIVERLHNSSIDWHLTKDEKRDVLLAWLRKTVRSASALERHFLTLRDTSLR